MVAQGITAMFAPTVSGAGAVRAGLAGRGGAAAGADRRRGAAEPAASGPAVELVNDYGPTEGTVLSTSVGSSPTTAPRRSAAPFAARGPTSWTRPATRSPSATPASSTSAAPAWPAAISAARPDRRAVLRHPYPRPAVPHRRPGPLTRDGELGVRRPRRRPGAGPRLPGRAMPRSRRRCASTPGVTGACVLGRDDATGSVSLVGFYAAPAPIADLRSWLADPGSADIWSRPRSGVRDSPAPSRPTARSTGMRCARWIWPTSARR